MKDLYFLYYMIVVIKKYIDLIQQTSGLQVFLFENWYVL
jgi:hypothetical protein